MSGAHILIIDDSPEDAEYLAYRMGQDDVGLSFDLAQNRNAALKQIATRLPDCIFLDYRLGVETGLELLPELLAASEQAAVILMTVQGSEKVAAEAIKSGASDYMVKGDHSGTYLCKIAQQAIERVQMRRRLEAQEETLRRQGWLQALGELSSGMAHDFNNMLATIRFGVEGVMRDVRKESSQRKLDVVLQTVDRAAERTEGLLAFASKQASRVSAQPLSVVMQDLSAFVESARDSGCDVRVLACSAQEVLYCDHAMLQNALFNLVLNARDAIFESGVGGGILVAAEQPTQEPGMVSFLVSDDGPGVAPELLKRITDPFFTTRKSEGGTGLGLSIVHGFATQSEGRLDIASRPGEGATFTLTIPLGGPQIPVQTSPGPPLNKQHAKGKVLVVEDEVSLARLIQDALQQEGYDTMICHDLHSACDRFADLTPEDAIVTDIMLSDAQDGVRLARSAQVSLPGIRVIGITGFAELNSQDNDLHLFKAVLNKPFALQELIEALGTGRP